MLLSRRRGLASWLEVKGYDRVRRRNEGHDCMWKGWFKIYICFIERQIDNLSCYHGRHFSS